MTHAAKGSLGKYGTLVIGDEKFAAEQVAVKTLSWKYGTLVVDPAPGAPQTAPPPVNTLADQDYNELRTLAKAKGLKFDSPPSKADLIAALAAAPPLPPSA